MKGCLLCGVGGQGTVLASRIIATAAMEKGLFARTAETIGMAQRGGSVVSHVRYGENVSSPMIPLGKADMILGFEPGEAVRNLPYLKKGGVVIVCDKEIQPVTASLSGITYNGKEMLSYLKSHVDKCYVLNAERIISECGSAKVLNIALLGAMAKSGVMDLFIEDIEKVLTLRLKPKFIDINKKALKLGAECVSV